MKTRKKTDKTEILPEQLVLQKPEKEVKPMRLAMFFGGLLFLAITPVYAYFFFPKLLEKFQEGSFSFSMILLMAFMLLLAFLLFSFMAYIYQAMKRARIILDSVGIHYRSNLPSFFQGWIPNTSPRDWSAQWQEVTAIHLKHSPTSKMQGGTKFIALGLHMGMRYQELFPVQWVNADEQPATKKPPGFIQWRRPNAAETEKALLFTPLLKYLAKNRILVKNEITIQIDKNLFSNSFSFSRVALGISLLTVICLFVFVLYPQISERLKDQTYDATPVAAETTPHASHSLPREHVRTLKGHQNNVIPLVFSPDGKMLASGSKDKTVMLWDAETGNALKTLKSHNDKVQAVAFSPDGTLLASGSEDNTIKLWEVNTGKLTATLTGHDKTFMDYKGVFSVAFSPDGKTLASANWDYSVMLWEMPGGKTLHLIKGHKKRFWGLLKGEGSGHENSVHTVAFSPDGETLASGGFDNVIKLWEVSSGRLLNTLHWHSEWILCVTFSPDGRFLASSGHDKSVRLWDARTGKRLRLLKGHTKNVPSVSFSPDSQVLVSSSDDNTVKFWEVSSGVLLHTLKAHKDYVNTAVFSPDGEMLATASGDDTVKLWRKQR
ncbi:MAG: WD40 repeat domain-containing protein [Gammaproteobacteria bacterium]|nr:WD40 repeat domain-containing protein [Gammaproteobacteria bacterium]